MPGQEGKRDINSWDEPWECSQSPQQVTATMLTRSSGCLRRTHWDPPISWDCDGERQSSPALLNTKFREKSHWEKKVDRPGSAEGFTGGLLGQWTHFVHFMLMNLCLPQAPASSSPSTPLLLLPSSALLQAMLSCTSFHGNQTERSWFPPKSHSKHNFVPSGLFCYLFSHPCFFPPCSTDETEFILMTQICKAQVSSISQAEVAISIQMGCLKKRQVWTLTSVIFSTKILPCSGLVLITGQSLVRFKQHFSNMQISQKVVHFPHVPRLPLPTGSFATCCSKETFFSTALDCITAVCKTPYRNKALEMEMAATLHPSWERGGKAMPPLLSPEAQSSPLEKHSQKPSRLQISCLFS